jgi:hypothetical protein
VPTILNIQVNIHYKNLCYLDNTYSGGEIAMLSETLPQFLHIASTAADNIENGKKTVKFL